MIDNCTGFLRSQITEKEVALDEVCTEQQWCKSDMTDGIDYDYSMDRYDDLEPMRQELLFDIARLTRKKLQTNIGPMWRP
jgi:hypothetical protein